MFLLDTNVVSELRKSRPHGAVVAWMAEQAAHTLYLSAMTVAEIQQGIERTRDQDVVRAAELEAWLERSLLPSAQVLAMDAPVCRAWAKLMHHRTDTLAEDAFIAATAQCHGLTVVTRNVRDFAALGVPILNPFEFRPG
jgi:predicted nucleic acid-binding protein